MSRHSYSSAKRAENFLIPYLVKKFGAKAVKENLIPNKFKTLRDTLKRRHVLKQE
jgi:hypothetical protein